MEKFIVITTINEITKAIEEFSKYNDWNIVIVGDKKTPELNLDKYPNIVFLSIEDQKKLGFKSYEYCPFNHYSRKNLGYLYAINHGAKVILDTDDDNIPYENWFTYFSFSNEKDIDVIKAPNIFNVYKLFTDEFIWPRGFPLTLVKADSGMVIEKDKPKKVGVIQGLADIEPDVDAIYRLIIGKQIKFHKREPVVLDHGVYCPFNSQNTLWFKEAFVYMYLPYTVSFRFTDILRGYVAQRGMWENGLNLAFTSSSVYQERNIHNLLLDFEDEISCYLNAEKLIDLLNSINLQDNPLDNIVAIYKALYEQGLVKETELNGVNAWIEDVEKIIK